MPVERSKATAKILVVDDEQAICWAFSQLLEPRGYLVLSAASAEEALEKVAAEHPDLILLDIRLPGRSGLDTLPELKKLAPETPVVVMTAHGTMETAVEAIKRGACDYLTKPIHNEDVLHHVHTTLKTRNLSREVTKLRRELEGAERRELLVGKSPAIQQVYKTIGAVAGADCSVLIRGESGTGKELTARAVHGHSARKDGPFVTLNCAAVPEALLESELYGHVKGAFTGAIRDRVGKAELADGGTLFLDEIGDMPSSIQAKLLRFIEQKRFERVGATEVREVDVRILAATHQDLRERIEQGAFREDLYYRLNVVSIELPPLRARRDDIPLLATHFMTRAAVRDGRRTLEMADEVPEILRRCDWPGNVRELKNAVEHAAVLARGGGLIRAEHLPSHVREGAAGGKFRRAGGLEKLLRARADKSLDESEKLESGKAYAEITALAERIVIEAALDRVGGNQVKTARLLGVHRTTLRKKMEEYGL